MNNIIFTLCTTEYTNLALDTPAREIGKWADMSDWVHKFPDIELHEWVDQGTIDREPSRRPYLPRQFFQPDSMGGSEWCVNSLDPRPPPERVVIGG